MSAGAPPPWRTIHDEARRRIAAREWRPGQTIPTETELAEEFEVSRGTVNRALRELADTGLIERRRRGGTRVAETPVRRARAAIPLIREEVEATGALYGYRLLAKERAEAPAETAARFPPGAPLLRVEAVHSADGAAFLHEARWINLALAPTAAAAPFDAVSANEWLVRNAPFTHGEMGVAAAEASNVEAAILNLAPGAPLLVIDRATYSGDAAVTIARLAYTSAYRLRLTL